MNAIHILTSSPLLLCVAWSIGQPIPGTPIATDRSRDPVAINPAWWSQLGGSSTHHGSSSTPRTSGANLSNTEWISTGDGSITLNFTPQAGVVADDERVYAIGLDEQFSRTLAAFDQSTGDLAWATPIPFALLDSWSTPTLDAGNNTILVASAFTLVALDRFTGELVWSTPFDLPLVNASPCVTDDLGDSDRVFITDYSFASGATGSLACINVDPFDAIANPYDPGEVVWSVQLPGECSGNTPAYLDGVVYVSTADNGSGGAGHVLAFDATATTEPTPIWDTPNPESNGFYGAVSVADGYVYASSYNFHGLQRSANTIKLDSTTGALQWSVPTVRTDAAPLVLPDGKLIVSGGIPTSPTTIFTGSLPAIELIDDQGTSAVVLWDSFEATHEDLNSSGSWDHGEPFMSIGGWGHHPIAFHNHGPYKLLVGTMTPPTGGEPFTHADAIHTIDLSKHPSDPGFIISTQPNIGTTPALIGNRVFTTSSSGIAALRLAPDQPTQPLIQRVRAVVDGESPMKSLKPTP